MTDARRRPAPAPEGAGSRRKGSEILGDDTLQRRARSGNVDRVLVTRGEHYAGQLENRRRRSGKVEIELIGGPGIRGGIEIQVRRCGIHGKVGYLLAEIDEYIERGASRGNIDHAHACGPARWRQVVVVQHERGERAGGSGQCDRGVGRRRERLRQRQQRSARGRGRFDTEAVRSGCRLLIVGDAGIGNVRQLQRRIDEYVERRRHQRGIDHLVLREQIVDDRAGTRAVVIQQRHVDQLAAALAKHHDVGGRMLGEGFRRRIENDLFGARRRDADLETRADGDRSEGAGHAIRDIAEAGRTRG